MTDIVTAQTRPTRDAICLKREAQAIETFADHQITKESPGRWLIFSSRGMGCWAEIICLEGKGLHIDGDVDPVTFRYGPVHPLARVRWMGDRAHAWDHYFEEKACIGSGGSGSDGSLREWIPEVAYDDLCQLRDEGAIDEGEPGELDDVLSALQNSNADREGVLGDLYDLGYDSEDVGSIGEVPSHRMFHAHAALQRLTALLVARGDFEPGPPAAVSEPLPATSQLLEEWKGAAGHSNDRERLYLLAEWARKYGDGLIAERGR
jgi:hypothetical protein